MADQIEIVFGKEAFQHREEAIPLSSSRTERARNCPWVKLLVSSAGCVLWDKSQHDQSAGNFDEFVPWPVPVARDSLSMGIVFLDSLIQP